MMDMNPNHTRLVKDYVLGPKIGAGSFAVVWRAKHRITGVEVAVKEIDKKSLSPKVKENLLKEISILTTIDHPNIIRLFESIETKETIFLVLEYCDGGDLAGYIHRHGKVLQGVASHFMRQLAAGLQVLQEKNLIHRDLKPQNLLLSSSEAAPQLKIGDFGFARYVTPQDLAATLCGSPLYMAPEIIQNQKYDSKADLWSVGAILFQLVTGKPPFEGNSQYQLFQNILASTELRFPQGALEELHPHCVDLCRSLLRQNPVERLTFNDFFNHKFLEPPRLKVDIEKYFSLSQVQSTFEQFSSAAEKISQLHPEHYMRSAARNSKLTHSSVNEDMAMHAKSHGGTFATSSVHGTLPNILSDTTRKPVERNQCSLDQLGVADLMVSIEKDYVLVNHHSASSFGDFSYHLETSKQDNSTIRAPVFPPKKNSHNIAVDLQTKESTAGSVVIEENPQACGSNTLGTSSVSKILREDHGPSTVNPSNRLHMLHQYVQAVEELAKEKHNAELFMESFALELVVLAIWKKALQICNSWLVSTGGSELHGSSSANESKVTCVGTDLSSEITDKTDFTRLSSLCELTEQGFILAYNRAEKLSSHLMDVDAAAEMPDAMEIIFQKALSIGASGAVDEYTDNKGGGAVSYSKAMLLLSFIVVEATSLPLNPPFTLTPANEKRIESYILNLQSHQTNSKVTAISPFNLLILLPSKHK